MFTSSVMLRFTEASLNTVVRSFDRLTMTEKTLSIQPLRGDQKVARTERKADLFIHLSGRWLCLGGAFLLRYTFLAGNNGYRNSYTALGYFLAVSWVILVPFLGDSCAVLVHRQGIDRLGLGSFLGDPWVILGSFLGRSWVILGSFLGHPWVVLGSSLGHPWVVLGSFLGHPW